MAAQWATLPEPGGWLDQPDDFIHDVGIFSRRIAYLRQLRKANKRNREEAERRLGIRDRFGQFRRG